MANFSRQNTLSDQTPPASSPLLNAAMAGDASLVETLLGLPPDALVDVNCLGKGRMTPLLLATEGNHLIVIRRLLMSNSIDVNSQDDLGRTAVIIASQKGFPEALEILLESGPNLFLCANGGYTALHIAAWHGHLEVVKLLLGIRENQEFGSGKSHSSEMLRSSKNLTNNLGETRAPLETNIKTQRSPRSRECEGVAWHIKSFRERIPESGFGDVASKNDLLKFLEAKTSPELLMPLHLAAGNGHDNVTSCLLESYGEAVGITEILASLREKVGNEALNTVKMSIIKILNSQEEIYSSEDGETNILKSALDKVLCEGLDTSSVAWSSIDALVSYVNAKDSIGRTPLHYACGDQHTRVIEKLLEVFVMNMNATDMDGFTPMHLSTYKGDQAAVELFLEHDSKFKILNPNIAARHNKSTRVKIAEVKRIQQRLGTIVLGKNFQDSIFAEERDGVTALHYAVEGNHHGIVSALAGHSGIDVFAVASTGTRQSVMEAPDPGGLGEKSENPLTIAIFKKDRQLLQLLLKSERRNRVMKELQMVRGYFSRSPNFEQKRKKVKEHHSKLLKTAVDIIKSDSKLLKSNLFNEVEEELAVILNTLLRKPLSNKLKLLHHAAFAGLSSELMFLLSISEVADEINAQDSDHQSALHFATMEGETAAVKVLVMHKSLRPNEEDRDNRTALQFATEKGWRDIITVLMGCPDVALAVDRLYKDRGVNNNAANAILVVSALIASVTFAGWLQPPLGLRNYYDVKPQHGDPPGTIESFAAVQQSESVLIFWVFNSLSFFFAMATVISGAAEVLPMRDAFIGQEVRMVRGGLVRTSVLLVFSVIFVLVAFAAAGIASLPPLGNYKTIMVATIWSGGSVCFGMLTIFWTRMVSMLITDSGNLKINFWRWQEQDINSLFLGKVIWKLLQAFNLIPENYARFDSRRLETSLNFKKKIVWGIIKLFNLDQEEYWKHHTQ